MKLKVRVGRLFGMGVYLHATFAILVGYSMWGLAMEDVLCGVIVVASILAHEVAHAATGRMLGMTPVKITFHGLGACVRFRREIGNDWRGALVVLAGPCVNLLIAAGAWAGAVCSRDLFYCFRSAFCYICIVNLIIGGFNLLPAYPLDGGKLFRWFVSLVTNERKAFFFVMCVGIVLSSAYVGWECYNAVSYGEIVDLCFALPIAVVVVLTCWLEYSMLRSAT